MVGFQPERPRAAPAERGEDVAQVATEVGEPPLEPAVEHDVDQRMAQPLLQGVIAAVRRRIGVDVLGRHHRPHEYETVVEVAATQCLDGDGVEERLRALGLLVVDQEPDEMELHLLPERVAAGAVEPDEAVFARDVLGGLVDAAVVEIDPVARHVLNGEPVAGLVVPARRARAFAEHGVVLVEAVEQRPCDAARLLGGILCLRDRGEGGDRRGHRGNRANSRILPTADGGRTPRGERRHRRPGIPGHADGDSTDKQALPRRARATGVDARQRDASARCRSSVSPGPARPPSASRREWSPSGS